jgi:hypothetical protein
MGKVVEVSGMDIESHYHDDEHEDATFSPFSLSMSA